MVNPEGTPLHAVSGFCGILLEPIQAIRKVADSYELVIGDVFMTNNTFAWFIITGFRMWYRNRGGWR